MIKLRPLILLIVIFFLVQYQSAEGQTTAVEDSSASKDNPLISWGTRSISYTSNSRFRKNILVVSNIQFCLSISPAEEDDPFAPGGLDIEPLPSNQIPKDKPALVYFEIYNLKVDEENNAAYIVQYIVQKIPEGKKEKIDSKSDKDNVYSGPPKRDPRGYLSLENEIAAKNAQQVNYVEIDLSRLSRGKYEFLVIVSDLRSSQHSTGQRQIELVP